MPLYTFFLQDGPNAVPRFELEWFDAREEAAAHARRLLEERTRCSTIAIAEGDVVIDRLGRLGA